MNETLNNNQFLFLKQQLVIFEARSLDAVVTVGDADLSYEDLGKSIRETIDGIDINMTVPVALMEQRKTNIDFQTLSAVIDTHIKVIENKTYADASYEHISELINQYPKTKQVIVLASDDTKTFVMHRDGVLKLLGLVSSLVGIVTNWTTSRTNGSGCPVREILLAVNYIQMLDELFEYTNEKFGA